MSIRRGDVVIVDWPLFRPGGTKPTKPRPAVVAQNDKDNNRLTNTILAMVTSVTHRSPESTQLLVEIGTPDGKLTGLRTGFGGELRRPPYDRAAQDPGNDRLPLSRIGTEVP